MCVDCGEDLLASLFNEEVTAVKYSFTCPACGHRLSVEAMSDGEAVDKLMEQGEGHMKETRPEGLNVSEEQMRNMVRSQMKQG